MTAALLGLLLFSAPARDHRCGVERWAVKTLQDGDAAELDLDAPSEATVESLRAFEPPSYSDENPREPAIEGHVYAVVAYVLGFKMEADSDFHVVIASAPLASAPTMIVEVVDPACAGETRFLPWLKRARSTFLRYFQSPTKHFVRLKVPMKVRVTGPAFFDKRHGQTGVAPNGIELHPATITPL